jgi:hypothetical protein
MPPDRTVWFLDDYVVPTVRAGQPARTRLQRGLIRAEQQVRQNLDGNPNPALPVPAAPHLLPAGAVRDQHRPWLSIIAHMTKALRPAQTPHRRALPSGGADGTRTRDPHTASVVRIMALTCGIIEPARRGGAVVRSWVQLRAGQCRPELMFAPDPAPGKSCERPIGVAIQGPDLVRRIGARRPDVRARGWSVDYTTGRGSLAVWRCG